MKNIDWKNLPFGYQKTDQNIRCYYKDGKWGEPEVSSSEYINIHIAATALHYGQEAFEGMKAFRGKDGKIRLFRWEENSKRLNNSAKGIKMAEVPKELFKEIVGEISPIVQFSKRDATASPSGILKQKEIVNLLSRELSSKATMDIKKSQEQGEKKNKSNIAVFLPYAVIVFTALAIVLVIILLRSGS